MNWRKVLPFLTFLLLINLLTACSPQINEIDDYETDKQTKQSVEPAQPQVLIHTADNTFTVPVEIAVTPSERQQGLMYRTELEGGMLFIFPKDTRAAFWMKNTKIPLDMLFIDSNLTIVNIAHSAQPCTQDPCKNYPAAAPIQYVLEVNGGFSMEKNIKAGDKITLSSVS